MKIQHLGTRCIDNELISDSSIDDSTLLNDRAAKVIATFKLGNGDELFDEKGLQLIGAHPFSKSTRQRRIRSGEYPAPIKLSPQKNVWTGRSIREWLLDPVTYKTRVNANGVAKC